MSYDGGGIQSITAGSGINISGSTQNPTISATPTAYQGTYYKSTNQNVGLSNTETNITFDEEASWNNTNNYITLSESEDFTVSVEGLYQLELNVNIVPANGATWNQGTNKHISIDIKRGDIAKQIVIGQTAAMAAPPGDASLNYNQSLCATFGLQYGDVINCRVFMNYSSGPPQIAGVSNTFDFGTWFSWRLISS